MCGWFNLELPFIDDVDKDGSSRIISEAPTEYEVCICIYEYVKDVDSNWLFIVKGTRVLPIDFIIAASIVAE